MEVLLDSRATKLVISSKFTRKQRFKLKKIEMLIYVKNCYNPCLLVMAWTRVKGNDDMIGCAASVSVSTSCSRYNNLA